MNPYQIMVADYARLHHATAGQPLGGFPPLPRPELAPDAPKVLIFSPHPDDEVIIGGLALRLMREARWRVANVAVTLGRKPERQAGRWAELQACCACIGFDLIGTGPHGLIPVEPATRQADPAHWAAAVRVIADILAREQPRVILFPHATDWNSTHIGVHFLLADALAAMPKDFTCYTIETEFWGAMSDPNLLVEITPADLGDLITALTDHVGEVQRNPYHLSLPAWMQDNVRRGAELVGGQGGGAPNFDFATVYRLRQWRAGEWLRPYPGGRLLAAKDNPAALFP